MDNASRGWRGQQRPMVGRAPGAGAMPMGGPSDDDVDDGAMPAAPMKRKMKHKKAKPHTRKLASKLQF